MFFHVYFRLPDVELWYEIQPNGAKLFLQKNNLSGLVFNPVFKSLVITCEEINSDGLFGHIPEGSQYLIQRKPLLEEECQRSLI